MAQQLYRAKNIIIGTELKAVQNAGVLVENGKIVKIYDNMYDVNVSEGTEVIDLGETTLMPGMIDCHNHLALDTRIENHLVKMEDCEAEQTLRALKTMQDDLMSGVTTSRCCGDRFYLDVFFKKAQQEGRVAGPRLVISGIGMRASHGHGYVGMPFDGPAQFQKQARENLLQGVDFLKIFDTKVINATPFIFHFMTPAEIRAVTDAAHSVDKPVACHCSGGIGLNECVENGVDCLEHVYYITPDQVELVKKEDRWVTFTPSYALNDTLLFKFSPHGVEGSLREKEIITRCLETAIEGGLKFGIGTDGIHEGLAQEAAYVAGLGAKNIDVLAGITTNAAKLCRVDHITGSITEGLAADMIAVSGNPLEDINALKNVQAIIQTGNRIK